MAVTPWLRRWRWPIRALGLVAVLLLAAELSAWPFLRQPMQRALSTAIGLPVRLDDPFDLKLLASPRLRVGRLQIGAADNDKTVFDAGDFEARWAWMALWRWQRGGALRLKSLTASEVNAHLVRDAAGHANWKGKDTGADSGGGGDWPQIDWLAIERGRLDFEDAAADTRLSVRLHGAERSDAASPAGTGYQIDIAGTYAGLPLALQARSAALLPLLHSDAAEQRVSPIAVQIEGTVGRARLRFEGSAAALAGAPRLQGQIRLQAASMAAVGDVLGLTLPRTPPFDLRGELRHAGSVWQLRDASASIGDSRLGGSFRYDTHATPPRLSGSLSGTRLMLSDLGPAVGAPPPAQGKSAAPHQVLPHHRFELPSLGRMDADLRVDIDELAFGTAQLQPMQDLRAHLLLQQSVLQLQDLQAGVGGGRVWGHTQLDGRDGRATWAADLRFAEVEVSRWIRAAGRSAPAPGSAASAPPYLTGEMLGAVRVQGQGTSTAQILGSLDGRVQVRLRNGTVSHLLTEMAGLDLAQALGVAARGDDALPLHCARFDLMVQQGVVQPTLAVIDNRDSTVRLEGRVDLRDETLDLRSNVRPKDISPLSFRAPLRVTGTLSAPQVSVDAAPLAARALASVALAVIATPAAALLPWVELGSSPDEAPCEPVAATGAASAPRAR